jgi:CRISPR-associated protein Cas1
MIKRTLYFSNPAYLKKRDNQLVVELAGDTTGQSATMPIEDIGMVILDHPQITLTHALMMALNENNVALLSCNATHLPQALMMPLFSHHAFTEKLYTQLESSQPLKKNLWQQTVVAKIENQAAVLQKVGINTDKMEYFQRQVKSGDPENVEGRAAAYYWENLFQTPGFRRHRFGDHPNGLLNYGYAILRSVVARALVASGMLPAVGIHHRNKYNPYCLADDIMEPYRPYVDQLVMEVMQQHPEKEEMSMEQKRALLQIPAMDIMIDEKSSPLMVGVQRTTASLAACFEGASRKLIYPVLQ